MEQTPMTQNPAAPMAKPKIILTGELIKSALSDYRQNWQKFAYLLLIPLVISYIVSVGSYVLDKFTGKTDWPWQVALLAVIVFIIFFIAFAALYVFTYISEFLLLKDLTQEVSFKNLREWYKRAKPYFWVSVGVSIIYTILTLLGLALLIIPGIIFGIFYCFTIYAVMFEDHKFEGSFGRSRELVRGYWWPVFGRILAGIAIIYLVYIVIGGIFAGIAWLLAAALQVPSSDMFKLIYDLVSVFVGLAVGPLTMIYTYKIYQSLRSVKGN